MKPSKLYEALHALIGERVPLHIWGPCGVGKSQIVGQVADDLNFSFLDVRAVQLDPVDLRGLPRIASDQTEWVPPKFLPTTGKGILFLDELTSAPQMTQAGCYQLVLDRKLGEYVLPEGWVVIAAGNPASERGVHFAMPRPLRNRFVHLELEADLDDWCKWAVKARVCPEIIAFLRFKPELLHAADTTADADGCPSVRSFPCRRPDNGRGLARESRVNVLWLGALLVTKSVQLSGSWYEVTGLGE
jgi:AAA domain (dynein-related subfamily)